MPRLSNIEREGKAAAAEICETIDQALDYETSDEDIEQTEPPASPAPPAPPAKPARQRKKVLAVVQPSAEVTEVVLSRPVKRRQVVVYADDVDEPLEVVQRHRRVGRPAQPKVTVVNEPRASLTARDVKRRARELEVEELEAVAKRRIARRKDGSADGRSLAKRSSLQMESARRLVEANRARRKATAEAAAKTVARATIVELADGPVTRVDHPTPQPMQSNSPNRHLPQPSRFKRRGYFLG